jgi:hypothetical protein
MIGGGATAFMRLGNHQEAEQAASFIGRHHKFVLSGFTATMGRSRTTTRSEEHGYGTSQSHGSSATHGWSEGDHLGADTYSGSSTRNRESGRSENWGSSRSWADGTEWSDAASYQRVYEYAVEPALLQNLAEHAVLLTSRNPVSAGLQPVECHPAIITMPSVTMASLHAVPAQPSASAPLTGSQHGAPQLEPRQYQPRWPRQAPDGETARQPLQWRGDHRRRR